MGSAWNISDEPPLRLSSYASLARECIVQGGDLGDQLSRLSKGEKSLALTSGTLVRPPASGWRARPSTKDIHAFFSFRDELGSGAYSTVFLAVSKSRLHKSCRGCSVESGVEVAVKRIRKSSVQSEEAIESLYQEVSILQQVNHPHVMAFHDYFEDTDYFYIVTELMTGGELFDRI